MHGAITDPGHELWADGWLDHDAARVASRTARIVASEQSFGDDGDVARRMVPYTTAESFNPEDLWKWMARYEETTGGSVLAIAHNGNLSNGMMRPVFIAFSCDVGVFDSPSHHSMAVPFGCIRPRSSSTGTT